jgi:hypothetical protein
MTRRRAAIAKYQGGQVVITDSAMAGKAYRGRPQPDSLKKLDVPADALTPPQ